MKPSTPAALLLVAFGLAGCGTTAPPPAASGDRSKSSEVFVARNPQGIRTTTAERKPIPDFLQIPAKIEPDPTRVIRVFPAVGGRLVRVAVRPGDRVRQGQVLAILDSSEISAASADYQKARADAAMKEKALRRASMLYENKVLAEKDYQQAQADADVAHAQLAQAQDRLRFLGLKPDFDESGASSRLEVLAPRSGVVLDIGAAPGELSKSLDAPQPLCTIADLSTVWVLGDVFEKDVAGLRAGDPAEVTVNAYPGEKWNGRVAVISNAVDPATRTLKVRVVLANPGLRLKPEMFGTIRLLRSTSMGMVVPAAAVVREGVACYVYVETGSGRFERRPVTLGRALDQQIEVTAGLKPRDVVVSEGALLLRAATQE
jgi:cobalt-zinc-cadmium efflux system membrane fusion protein